MKYLLSLCCIIKDERYLEEFIIYYRILGVEHFYIYDNESSVPIQKRLHQPYFQRMCTIIPIKGTKQQLNAYEDCIKRTIDQTKWLIVVDGDEFILPKKHKSLRDFIREYENYDAIGINWMMFGSNFHEKIQPGIMINNYILCEGKQNQHIKSIIRPNQVIKFKDPHHVKLKNPNKYVDPHKREISGPFNKKPTLDIIQINHYWGKSEEEHYIKRDRGRATTDKKRIIDSNLHKNFNNLSDDLIIKKYYNDLLKIYNELNIKPIS
jgi:vacuolar-type H+-ATPase subunit F/Vma7